MTATAEKFEFQAEVNQLLELMIHSLYSHREIFLRELISNSSDALDKLRYESVTQHELGPAEGEYRIDVEIDKENRTLTVSDNGIGMDRDEIISNIGTIARSGTKTFLKQLSERKEEGGLPPELIGQFGVGFYSSFIVADEVVLTTRKAGHSHAWRWVSTGDGSYTLEDAERAGQGTTIQLHLRETAEEEEDFTDKNTARSIIKKYSDFITYPIRLSVTGDTEAPEIVNAMKPLWARRPEDVTKQEYAEFYRHVTHDWGEPLKSIHFSVEGTLEYQAVLFIPEQAPFELFAPDRKHGIHLYAKRVFIMEDCRELLPEHLRFVKGVVDCADISLNVSREMIQHDRQIRLIRKRLIKKIFDALEEMRDNDRELYVTFWKQFGAVLKEGLYSDEENRDRIRELILFQTTKDETSLSTFREYVERMPAEQKEIYYLTGESRDELERSPHLERLKEKNYEVILFTDPVDELIAPFFGEFDEKNVKSAAKGDLDLDDQETKKKVEEETEEHKGLIEYLEGELAQWVKNVKVSGRLKESPVCLVTEEGGMAPHIERMLQQQGQKIPPMKRTLEINPDHPLVNKMQELFDKDRTSQELKDIAYVLYGLGAVAEGINVPEPGRFSSVAAKVMAAH